MDAAAASLRGLLVALVMLACAGLAAELLLLEHVESFQQWLPLVTIGIAFVAALAFLLRPSVATIRAFRVAMLIAVAIGIVGVYLHYVGNSEFELEIDPTLRGLDLLWNALQGATPALAPGALVQVGLIGLLSTHRHPLLRRPAQV